MQVDLIEQREADQLVQDASSDDAIPLDVTPAAENRRSERLLRAVSQREFTSGVDA